jgi:hypothetical protein
MTNNGASSRIQSEVDYVYRNGHTSTPSPAGSPIRENSQQIPQQVIPLQDQHILGPPQSDEVTDNSTPVEAMLNNLLCAIQ